MTVTDLERFKFEQQGCSAQAKAIISSIRQRAITLLKGHCPLIVFRSY
jgi:hypothetical protein